MLPAEQLKKYEAMREAGAGAREICARAQQDGLGTIDAIYVVRKLFGLSIEDAKAMSIETRTGESAEKYYEWLAGELEGAAKELESEERNAESGSDSSSDSSR